MPNPHCSGITTIPHAPFPRSECENRIMKARQLMKEHAFDAVLVTSEYNFRYFVDDTSTTPIQTTRPRFLLLLQSGEAIAIVPTGLDEFFRETTWIKDFRTWPGPNPKDEGVSEVAKLLNELVPENARIGIELGPESRLGMPGGDFLRISEAIRPRTFADASGPILTPLRMIKSESEIDRIRTVCRTVSQVFDNLAPQLHFGITEREACRLFELGCFIHGADKTPKIDSASGRGGYSRCYGEPTDKVLSGGDVLFIDAGCLFNFYWSDFNRNFSFGEADPHTQDAYRAVWEATEVGIAAAQPGVPICSVWIAMSDALSHSTKRGKSTTIGRMGHSMGLWMPELPSVQQDDNTILEPGMIINIEPSIAYPSYFDGSSKLMLHEEVIVVTENGPQLLTSRAQREMPVIK